MSVLLMKIVANLLKKHKKFNSSLDEATQEIVEKDYIHIGVAVDTEAGLIVPVVKDVDKKPYLQVAKELRDLAEKAKNRKLSVEEMQGSTFSISNQGGIGGGHFTPIIKKPDCAILGIGRGKLKPVAKNGAVVIRTIVPICLSYDHRIADGADAARMIRDLVETIENFKGEDVTLDK
jgi:pyruvate dehydrogenase E2 component (dihydrolipoamide acetyltransferase)